MGQHLSTTVAQGRAFMQVIDGKAADSVSGARIDVACPSDGKVFATIPASGAEDVDRAVGAARRAFEQGPWAKMPAVERGRLLTRLSRLLEENADELAALESRDTGKPARQGRADVVGAARYYEFYGGACDKIHGDTIPFLDGYTALTLREPHGVVAGIIPWNYPLQILGRVAGAALAMGNTVVAVPSQRHPLVATDLYQVLEYSDIPAGALNIVTGRSAELASVLAKHDDVDGLWLFADADTCAKAEADSTGNLKRVWTGNGRSLDWASDAAAGEAVLRRAVEVKNVWVPYGD